MATVVGDMLCFSEEEVGAIAFVLRHSASKNTTAFSDAIMLLADQLQTQVNRDPFEARRFSISIEQRRTRQ